MKAIKAAAIYLGQTLLMVAILAGPMAIVGICNILAGGV